MSGCDSVAILNLTINNSSSSTHDVTACDNYEWNGTTYSETGIFTFNTTTINGCDSVAILDLEINYSYESLDSAITCE